MTTGYPRLRVNLNKLKSNALNIKKLCDKEGIEIAGVIKGCSGLSSIAHVFEDIGVSFVASSRAEEIRDAKDTGLAAKTMLLRVPMLSEASEAVELFDISLNSEKTVLEVLNEEAAKQGKIHGVILMADLGDLREGFWDKEELVKVAVVVENEMANLSLEGVGTNLGCYGAISANRDKMEELIDVAHKVEAAIGRKLRYIGGGATTSLPLLLDEDMPEEINLLRIGEGILLSRDLPELWGYNMDYMHKDVFTLQAEVIEIKTKPSHPVGEIMFDAFGNSPTYEDRGYRKRALLALGKVDYAYCDCIFPRIKGVEVIGASSDHTILDIEDCQEELKVGDIVEFDLCYASIVFVSHSRNVNIEHYWE